MFNLTFVNESKSESELTQNWEAGSQIKILLLAFCNEMVQNIIVYNIELTGLVLINN